MYVSGWWGRRMNSWSYLRIPVAAGADRLRKGDPPAPPPAAGDDDDDDEDDDDEEVLSKLSSLYS